MDPQKVNTILDWAQPTSLRHLRSFFGFCNFYRRFIQEFLKLAKPLTSLTKKDTLFDQSPACQSAFDSLKKISTKAPILAHYKQGVKTIVETNSSDYVSSGVLSQLGDNVLLQPVAFFSKNLNPAECNYEIYDKELLTIIRCFKQWKPELEGTGVPVKVIKDHKSREYFMTTKKLTRRQARQAEFLSRFNFVISYIPGKKNQKADSLTRRPNDLSLNENEDCQQHLLQTILPAKLLEIILIEREVESTIVDKVVQDNLEDSYCSELRHLLKTGYPTKEIDSRHFSDLSVDSENCIRRFGRLWVSEGLYLSVIREVHYQIASGHPGHQKTICLLACNYYWPKMKDIVHRYIRNCHTCRRAQAPRDQYNGISKTLPIPTRSWTDVTLDFVTGLPLSNGYNAVLMVIDRLTKERHYIPCTTDENGTTAEATCNAVTRDRLTEPRSSKLDAE